MDRCRENWQWFRLTIKNRTFLTNSPILTLTWSPLESKLITIQRCSKHLIDPEPDQFVGAKFIDDDTPARDIE